MKIFQTRNFGLMMMIKIIIYNIQEKLNIQIESLSFYNINNIIAPTIAMHKNELFDWLLENNLVLKGDNKISFDKITILSAMSGDSHSLIELINRGLISSSNLQEIDFIN